MSALRRQLVEPSPRGSAGFLQHLAVYFFLLSLTSENHYIRALLLKLDIETQRSAVRHGEQKKPCPMVCGDTGPKSSAQHPEDCRSLRGPHFLSKTAAIHKPISSHRICPRQARNNLQPGLLLHLTLLLTHTTRGRGSRAHHNSHYFPPYLRVQRSARANPSIGILATLDSTCGNPAHATRTRTSAHPARHLSHAWPDVELAALRHLHPV